MPCNFHGCKFHPQSNGWCIGHGKQFANNSGEVKMPKEINKESAKMKEVKKELKKLYLKYLAQHPNCEIGAPGCTKKATCIHHVNGRLKDNILNQSTWKASCETCNLYVEEHHQWAKENGHKKSKFTTSKK